MLVDRSGILAHLLRERLLPPTGFIRSLKKGHSFCLVVVVRVPVHVSVIVLVSVLVPLHVPVLVTVTDFCSRFCCRMHPVMSVRLNSYISTIPLTTRKSERKN